MQSNRNKGKEITTDCDFQYLPSLIYRCGLTWGFLQVSDS
jgi:hypothetical protein